MPPSGADRISDLDTSLGRSVSVWVSVFNASKAPATGKRMSIRILHVISSVNPAGGGPVEGLKRLAAVHQRFGRSVEVVCLDNEDDEWVRNFPLKCYALGPTKLGKYRYSSRLVPWLRQHGGSYDAVFVNGIWQYHAFATWRALHGAATPYFVFLHGMLDPWFKKEYPLKHLKKWVFWPWSEYRILRDAAAVLFTCESERILARQSFWLYRCAEYVVNYGTASPPDCVEEQLFAFRTRFPDLNGKRLLLFLGRVHEKKGADLLFRAFARHIERRPVESAGVQIVMVGPNEHDYGEKMRRLVEVLGIKDRVTWAGMLTGDLKWGALRSAEAFVLPSHQENFGIAVAEAMGCGVPVLISKQVNIWKEIVGDGAGYAEDDTVEGTERLIEQWLSTEPSEWQAMGARARSSFNSRFVIERTAESVMAAYGRHHAKVEAADMGMAR